MLSVYHITWLAVCAALIAASLLYLMRKRPALRDVLSVCCVICVASELIKTFSMAQMAPATNGTTMHVYIKPSHLPLHLCSLQILFIFYARFAREGKLREILLAFMYPSCLLGALAALLIPTIFSTSIRADQAFTHPLGYQYFIYHAMLIVLGLYILLGGEADLRPKHYLTSLATIGVLGYASILVNSAFASATYVNNTLVSVDYAPNFFFTFRTPVGIKLTQLWHWYVYLIILALLCVALVAVCYIPVFLRARRARAALR